MRYLKVSMDNTMFSFTENEIVLEDNGMPKWIAYFALCMWLFILYYLYESMSKVGFYFGSSIILTIFLMTHYKNKIIINSKNHNVTSFYSAFGFIIHNISIPTSITDVTMNKFWDDGVYSYRIFLLSPIKNLHFCDLTDESEAEFRFKLIQSYLITNT